jgi:hypothetical protein
VRTALGDDRFTGASSAGWALEFDLGVDAGLAAAAELPPIAGG